MQIALRDRDKTPLWNLPGTKIVLTYESPGPIDIDPDSLTNEQRKIVWTGLQRQVLAGRDYDKLQKLLEATAGQTVAKRYAITDSGEYIEVRDNTPVRQIVPVQQELPKSEEKQSTKEELLQKAQEVVETTRNEKIERFKKILEKRLPGIKKELLTLSLQDLRTLKEVETSKKVSRGTVLTLINDMIAKKVSEVNRSIANNEGTYVVKERKESVQITDVEDSDLEDVIVRIGTEDAEEV